MSLQSVIKNEKLKELSDNDLKEKYFHFVNLIDLLDQKKIFIGEDSENEIRYHFSEIKRQCESRYHVSEFPMPS